MTETDGKPEHLPPEGRSGSRRLHIDAARAAELVGRVRGERDEPFGALNLVRAVIRPKKKPSAG